MTLISSSLRKIAMMHHDDDVYSRASGSRQQFHDDLVRVGQHIVSELQQEVYPHLQSSPDAMVGERSEWSRPLRTGPLQFDVHYMLMNHRNDLPNITEPNWMTRRGRSAQATDRDQEYLLVHQSGALTVTKPEEYTQFMATILPHSMINQTTFDKVKMELKLEGDIMVGATTGLVLEGKAILTNVAEVEASFEIDTLAPRTQRGTMSMDTAAAAASNNPQLQESSSTVGGVAMDQIRQYFSHWHTTGVSRFLASRIPVPASATATAPTTTTTTANVVVLDSHNGDHRDGKPDYRVGGKRTVKMIMTIHGETRVRVHGVVDKQRAPDNTPQLLPQPHQHQ